MTKTIEFTGWESVTDVPCLFKCDGTIRWAEAGYVPGYRICDGCGRHYELRDGTLVANGRRDKITVADRQRNAEALARADREHTVWKLIYAVQHALPYGLDGQGPEYDGRISGDDLPALRQVEASVQQTVGTVNIGRADSDTGIAARLANLRAIAYPAAWAVYQEFRAALPTEIHIAVSQDAATIRLCGSWDLGTYDTDALRAALPSIPRDGWEGALHGRDRMARYVAGN